ncbi:MAG: thioredoxin family protein, partial [Psychrosphaera sp.]|nr:thioredoxin family protein [Psychrosphaera sp.]
PHSGKPIEVNTEAALKQAIDAGGIVMVDFSAQWCGPCLLMEPAIDAVAQIYKGKIRVVKADVSLNTALAQAYGVRGFPTIIMFNDAKELSRISESLTQRQLTALVNDTIHAASIV